MKIQAPRLVVCLILVWFIAATFAVGQSDTEFHQSFGCSSTKAESSFTAELSSPSKLQLVPVTDEKEIDRAKADSFHTLHHKLDGIRDKIRYVDFYVHQDKQKDPEHPIPYSPLTIYVRIMLPDQTLWWRVAEPEKQASMKASSQPICRTTKKKSRSRPPPLF